MLMYNTVFSSPCCVCLAVLLALFLYREVFTQALSALWGLLSHDSCLSPSPL